jgi:hypothetical protein
MILAVIKKNIRFLAGLASILCVIMIIFSIYNISKNNLITLFTLLLGYSGFCCLGILYFLFSEDRVIKKEIPISYQNIKFRKLCWIVFVVLIISCLFILNTIHYTKPFLYYVIISFMVLFIILQVIFLKDTLKKFDILIILTQIIILSTLILGSSYLINPYLIGPDILYHFHNIQQLVNVGYLSEAFFHYYYFPSYYLSQAIFGVLVGLSPNGFNIINLSMGILSVLIAFFLGKVIFNDSKTGLISALLFSIAPLAIFCVVYNTSKIGGLFLFLLCLFIQIRIIQTNNVKFVALFWLAILPLFLWHPELSQAVMPILLAYLLTMFICKKHPLNFVSSGFVLYVIAYIFYLLFVHTSLGTSIVDLLFLERTSVALIQTIERTPDPIFYLQTTLAYLGITIMILFVAFLSFRWAKTPDKLKIFLLLILILLHINPLIGVFSGNFSLGAERSLITTSAVVTIIASGAIFKLFTSKTWQSIAVVSLIFFGICFFSVSSYLTGDGNDIFNDKIPRQTLYTTTSDFISLDFLNRTPIQSHIFGDLETLQYTMDPMRRFYWLPERNMSINSIKNADYIVINKPNMRRLNWENSSQGDIFKDNLKFYDKLYYNGEILVYH